MTNRFYRPRQLRQSAPAPAPQVIRNQVTGTVIITVPLAHSFTVPVPDAAPATASNNTALPVLDVTVITVYPPGSAVAGPTGPVFTLAGHLRPQGAGRGTEDFFDYEVKFTDAAIIPAGRAALRAQLSELLTEMTPRGNGSNEDAPDLLAALASSLANARRAMSAPSAPDAADAPPSGTVIPVDFAAPRSPRAGSKRRVNR